MFMFSLATIIQFKLCEKFREHIGTCYRSSNIGVTMLQSYSEINAIVL